MQDIIKHKTPHTDKNCRACRTYDKFSASMRRTQLRIDDILEQREFCTHGHTRTYVEPDVMDDHGDYNGGTVLQVCRDCLRVVEIRS